MTMGRTHAAGPVFRIVALAGMMAGGTCIQPVQAQTGPDAARSFREANEAAILRDFAEPIGRADNLSHLQAAAGEGQRT